MATLNVKCAIDANAYPAGVKMTDEAMARVNLERHEFHREWTYTISPKPK